MSWCKAVLTNQQVVAGELIMLVTDFEYVFRDQGEPKGVALFQGKITRLAIRSTFLQVAYALDHTSLLGTQEPRVKRLAKKI